MRGKSVTAAWQTLERTNSGFVGCMALSERTYPTTRSEQRARASRLSSLLPSSLSSLSNLSTSTSASSSRAVSLSVAIVGAGPAGLYVASKLAKRIPGTEIDVLEALPSPYGLVRSGVAPDHPETKNVIHQFQALLEDGTVEYFGNVRVGGGNGKDGADANASNRSTVSTVSNVSLFELRSMYDAVVLSYGAGSGRRLRVAGHGLKNVMSARDFVNWYNGVPLCAGGGDSDDGDDESKVVIPDLDGVRSVVVCGLGNVALDCARILLKDARSELHPTDMASRAVRALERARSGIEEVHVLSRRGPAQAACTPKELREMLGVKGVRVWMHPEGVLERLGARCEEELEGSRIHRRVVDVLRKRVAAEQGGKKEDAEEEEKGTSERHLHLHFLSSPAAYEGDGGGERDDTRVAATVVEKMKLDGGNTPPSSPPSPSSLSPPQRAIPTGETFRIPSQLVIESVGYRATPMEGAPFDEASGTVPNVLGRVDESNDLFCCGWLKRGPSGIIGTNLVDAEQTVDTMARHVRAKEEARAKAEDAGRGWGRVGLSELLDARGAHVVKFDAWKRVDAEELRRGEAVGKAREKFVEIDEMLRVARVANEGKLP